MCWGLVCGLGDGRLTEESVILKRLEHDIVVLCDRVRDLELRAARYDEVIRTRVRQTEGLWVKIVSLATAISVGVMLLERFIRR